MDREWAKQFSKQLDIPTEGLTPAQWRNVHNAITTVVEYALPFQANGKFTREMYEEKLAELNLPPPENNIVDKAMDFFLRKERIKRERQATKSKPEEYKKGGPVKRKPREFAHGGSYRGKSHAYAAGGRVTDTSKPKRRKK